MQYWTDNRCVRDAIFNMHFMLVRRNAGSTVDPSKTKCWTGTINASKRNVGPVIMLRKRNVGPVIMLRKRNVGPVIMLRKRNVGPVINASETQCWTQKLQ